MTEEAAKVQGGFVPTSGGPVAVVYNLPGDLKYPARYCQNLSGNTR